MSAREQAKRDAEFDRLLELESFGDVHTSSVMREAYELGKRHGREDGPAWQPIETVPQGVIVLVCSMESATVSESFYVEWFVDGKPCSHRRFPRATHWMTLPAAPKVKP